MEINRHTIVVKLKEVVDKVEDRVTGVGLGSRVSYKGPNSNGVTPELALSAIGGLLQSAGIDKKTVNKHIDAIGKDIVTRGTVVCPDSEKETKKTKGDTIVEAAEAFARMMDDERWNKVINNKSDIRMDKRGRKLCVWTATVLEIIGRDSKNGKKSRAWLEDLFLKEVAGIDDTDDE